ncbi:ParB/RepB/Spo0J family partition protein [Cryptosporangium sp. NPDC048952]|uniref:ParB/RepB/Spo0J family partition protein n=1 Tax=Cryptosporangium sp. NPDC048952 TaxID=3363961 RepID=UPI003713A876
MPQLRDIKTRRLVPNPRNARRNDESNIDSLCDTIQVVGIMEPLHIVEVAPPADAAEIYAAEGDDDPNWYMVVFGHRRRRAALRLELPTVPCLVSDDEDAARQLAMAMIENLHRENLTVTEEADGFRQLELEGWSAEKIAETLARPLERVRQSLTLQRLPQQARDAADAGTLTLDNAAELDKFTDDPDALARILKNGDRWGFRHALTEETRKSELRKAKDELRATLVLDGVDIVSQPADWGSSTAKIVDARTLLDKNGELLDPEAVKGKPGFAAIIQTDYNTPKPLIVCKDPEFLGYTRTTSADRHLSSEEREERARKKAAEEAHTEALRLAQGVRREFLKETYGTPRGAKKIYLRVLREVATTPGILTYSKELSDLVSAMAGITIGSELCAGQIPRHLVRDGVREKFARAGTDRLTRVLVARWAAGHESNLDAYGWQVRPEVAVPFFDTLVADGYTLSDAEQRLYGELHASLQPEKEQDEPAEQATDEETAGPAEAATSIGDDTVTEEPEDEEEREPIHPDVDATVTALHSDVELTPESEDATDEESPSEDVALSA